MTGFIEHVRSLARLSEAAKSARDRRSLAHKRKMWVTVRFEAGLNEAASTLAVAMGVQCELGRSGEGLGRSGRRPKGPRCGSRRGTGARDDTPGPLSVARPKWRRAPARLWARSGRAAASSGRPTPWGGMRTWDGAS